MFLICLARPRSDVKATWRKELPSVILWLFIPMVLGRGKRISTTSQMHSTTICETFAAYVPTTSLFFSACTSSIIAQPRRSMSLRRRSFRGLLRRRPCPARFPHRRRQPTPQQGLSLRCRSLRCLRCRRPCPARFPHRRRRCRSLFSNRGLRCRWLWPARFLHRRGSLAQPRRGSLN